MTEQDALFTDPLLADALTCLADADPAALEAVIQHPTWAHLWGNGDVRSAGTWAYSRTLTHYRFEQVDTWWKRGGWEKRPANRIAFGEIREALPLDVILHLNAWARTLPDTAASSFKLSRPFELWPDGDKWHPSYIEKDHKDPAWADRLEAWTLLIDALRDAAKAAS